MEKTVYNPQSVGNGDPDSNAAQSTNMPFGSLELDNVLNRQAEAGANPLVMAALRLKKITNDLKLQTQRLKKK